MTKQVPFLVKRERVKGNQVQVLSDPVTVTGESPAKMPLPKGEKARESKTQKSGNLLVLNGENRFRRKQLI